MNKSTILKDYNGNVLYPKTLHENVIGLPSITGKTKIFFGTGKPSSNKSAFHNPEENDIYINTDAENRQGYFYVLTNVVGSVVVWGHTYGNYTVQNVTPPNTTIGYYLYDVPLLREGLLWLDSSHNKIFICIGTSGSIITWKELTDFYTKSEVDALFDELQFKINKKAKKIKDTAKGSSISLTDSADSPLDAISIMGKSTQNGTPSIDTPIPIDDVTNEEIEITNGTDTQSAELTKTLRGISVSSGGNYTDNNNQQWICDTIERYKDGSGKYIQRIGRDVYDGSETWTHETLSGGRNNFYTKIQLAKKGPTNKIYCNMAIHDGSLTDGKTVVSNSGNFNICANAFSDTTTFKNFISTNNLVVVYQLEDIVETPLTAEQLAELDLDTYYPNTTITSNADVVVEYVCDTKNYIDKRMAELQNAIISQGGNV